MEPELAAELGLALTGTRFALKATDVAGLVGELAKLGWDAQRIQQLRASRMAAQQPWPYPGELELRRQFGFARFDAMLAQLRNLLGVSGTTKLPPAPSRQLTADEMRLLADKPPHWS